MGQSKKFSSTLGVDVKVVFFDLTLIGRRLGHPQRKPRHWPDHQTDFDLGKFEKAIDQKLAIVALQPIADVNAPGFIHECVSRTIDLLRRAADLKRKDPHRKD